MVVFLEVMIIFGIRFFFFFIGGGFAGRLRLRRGLFSGFDGRVGRFSGLFVSVNLDGGL